MPDALYYKQGTAGLPSGYPVVRLDNPLDALPIDFAASGNNIVIPHATGKKTLVYSLFLTITNGASITLLSGVTALTGAIFLNAGGGLLLDFRNFPWFVGAVDENFIIANSTGNQVSGRVEFLQVDP